MINALLAAITVRPETAATTFVVSFFFDINLSCLWSFPFKQLRGGRGGRGGGGGGGGFPGGGGGGRGLEILLAEVAVFFGTAMGFLMAYCTPQSYDLLKRL